MRIILPILTIIWCLVVQTLSHLEKSAREVARITLAVSSGHGAKQSWLDHAISNTRRTKVFFLEMIISMFLDPSSAKTIWLSNVDLITHPSQTKINPKEVYKLSHTLTVLWAIQTQRAKFEFVKYVFQKTINKNFYREYTWLSRKSALVVVVHILVPSCVGTSEPDTPASRIS